MYLVRIGGWLLVYLWCIFVVVSCLYRLCFALGVWFDSVADPFGLRFIDCFLLLCFICGFEDVVCCLL